MSTNNQTGERTGTLAEMPPAGSQRVGEEWTTPDETLWQVKRDPITGAQTWVPIAGPGAGASGAWPKYVVAPATGPAAPYQTIQSAIDAAVADGHTTANPTAVLIFPGSYAETVALAPGVDLIGLGEPTDGPKITGDVTAIFGAANDRVSLANLVVLGTLAIGGANRLQFRARNCRFTGGGTGSGVEITNTGGPSSYRFDDCDIEATDPGVGCLVALVAASITLHHTDIGIDATGLAAQLGASAHVVARGCDAEGRWDLVGTSRVDWYGGSLQTASQALSSMVAGTFFEIHDGTFIIADTDPVFAGAGGDVGVADSNVLNLLSLAPGITNSSARVAHSHATLETSVSVVATNEEIDSYAFSGLAGPVTFDLPPSQGAAATARDGREIAVCKDASAQTVAIRPAAGDTINIGTPDVTLAAGAGHGAILRLNRAANRWNVVALF